MSDKYSIKIEENPFICEKENDVVSHLKISTETSVEASPTVKSEMQDTQVNVLPSSATKSPIEVAASAKTENLNVEIIVSKTDKSDNGLSEKAAPKKRKTRRGKYKRKSSKPYAKFQWKFQIPRRRDKGRNNMLLGQTTLVPYNTNKFLMEDHMPPHIKTPSIGRTRDSSFSVDSEENYFYSLPEDEEEFLIKEFSSVYEDARCERLDAMTKSQLIQEYLQLEAAFDQMSRRMNAKNKMDENRMQQETTQSIIKKMQEKIAELSTDNLELRNQLDLLKAGNNPGAVKVKREKDNKMCSSSSDSSSSSSDSESDSTSTTSSSDSNITDNNDNDTENHRLYTNNHITNIVYENDSLMDAETINENHVDQKLLK